MQAVFFRRTFAVSFRGCGFFMSFTDRKREDMTEAIQKPSGGVTYYTLSDEQLHDYAKEVAKNVLMEFGVEFDKEQAKFTPDTKNEYKPLEFWLKKLNVNRSTVWRWQKQGLVTPRYEGKKLFFCQADLDELFARQKS